MNSSSTLNQLGWSQFFEDQLKREDLANGFPARIVSEARGLYRIQLAGGIQLWGELPGRLRNEDLERSDLPAVGDWVIVAPRPGEERATIARVLNRKSKLSRRAAGEKLEEQVLAANVDTAFVVSSLNNDLNPRRIERYVALIAEGGVQPVIILTKADLVDNVESKAKKVRDVAKEVPIHVVSVRDEKGIEALHPYLKESHTIVLLGSSGVGKSTLVNHLLGKETFSVSDVRKSDDRGRHTTTARHLVMLPRGGILIDTPGMRELQLWEAGAGVEAAFEDIEEIARQCKFTNCRHESEPSCAVKVALETGELSHERVKNYKKLGGELRHELRKTDKAAAAQEKSRWKKVNTQLRKRLKEKNEKKK